MADELQIAIKVDPAGSVPAISAVEDALAKAEARAKAFGALGPTFTKIAEHMRAMAAETAKARQAVDNLSSGFKQVADHMRVELLKNVGNAFSGLTLQIQREAEMLERIQKPMKEFEQDLRSLEMLQQHGKVTAKEYADELARIGKSAGIKPQGNPMDAVSLPGLPKAAGGVSDASVEIVGNMKSSLVGMLGPAALAASAIGAIGQAFSYWEQHELMIGRSTNALIKFYDTAEQARNALGEQQKLADDLRIGLDHAVDAYGAVREATQAMYLTSKQQVDVTRNLSEALIVDGKSAGDVADIMGRVQVAMDLNTLSSRDYLAILRKSPDVAEMMAGSLGMTAKQMMEMAKAGKINGAVLEEMVVGMSRTATSHAKFQQRVITDADNVRSVMLQQGQQMRAALGELEDAQDKAGISADEWALRTVNGLRKMADTLGLVRQGFADTTAMAMFATAAIGVTKAVNQVNADLATQADLLKKIRGPRQEYHQQIDNLDMLLKNHTITQHEFDDQLKAINTSMGIGVTKANAYTAAVKAAQEGNHNFAFKGDPNGPDAQGYTKGFSLGKDIGVGAAANDNSKGVDDILGAQRMGMRNNLTEWADHRQMMLDGAEATKKWHDELEKTNGVAGVLGETLLGGVGSFTDSIVDAATGADVAWGDFFNKLGINLLKAAAQAAALNFLTGSVTGAAGAGIGGGYGGLVGAIFGGAHATGGSYTAPNTGGGPDSIPVAFRMNPGETATFTNPGQVGPGAAQAPAPQQRPLTIENHIDVEGRALRAFDGGAGDRVVLGVLRRNPGAVRALLSK